MDAKLLSFGILILSATVHLFAQSAAVISKEEAGKAYPALLEAGSKFNTRFVEKVQEAKKNGDPMLSRDDWPMTIAAAVGKELHIVPVTPVFASGGGLAKFQKMTVAEVAGNSFSLEGALIELSGIDRVETSETERGVYEVTIWSTDSTYLTSKVSGDVVETVKTSRRLFVSVSKPRASGAGITIHGNFTTYEALSTVPKVVWK